MANMFSNKTEKQIPKTLHDCVKADATVANLHVWAERLESWGKFLFKALIVIGIISTICDAYAAWGDGGDEEIFISILNSIITWSLCAFIEYCAYHVLALLVSALASITQNTIISANVALLEASQHRESVESTPVPTTNMSAKKNTEPQKKCWACDTVQSAENRFCIQCGKTL